METFHALVHRCTTSMLSQPLTGKKVEVGQEKTRLWFTRDFVHHCLSTDKESRIHLHKDTH